MARRRRASRTFRSGSRPVSLLDLAERALANVTGEAQVTVVGERSLTSRFARSRPTQATGVTNTTVEVLCVGRGRTAAATTNATDADGLRAVALRAQEALASVTSDGDYPGLPQADPEQRDHDGHDALTARLEPSTPAAALAAVFAAAEERRLEAFGVWSSGEVTTAIASSTGVRVQEAVTDAYMKVIVRDPEGRSGFAAASSVRAAEIDARGLADRAAARVSAGEPVELGPGRYPVVLDADAVGTLLDFLGQVAFNGQAHAEGRGALSDRLGTRVSAAAINLADSPQFSGTLPRAFDAEGVAKAPVPLIEDGVARGVVHDTRSAARAGGDARSTGHALNAGGSSRGPRPTNLILIGGGERDEHELARPIERGLYVTRLWYVNVVREREALLTGMTRDGTFLIEDGRITRPARDVRFTDSALRILDATEALSSSQRLVSEGDFYGRRFASGVVCPALRARDFHVTGTKPAD
jgi:PmbA protein